MKKENKRGRFGFLKILIVICILIIVLLTGVLIGAYYMGFFEKNYSKNNRQQIILENPMKKIIVANLDPSGNVNSDAVIRQGISEFNESYINFILIAMGVDNLHKSPLFGNPVIELDLDNEAWNSEINNGALLTKQGAIDKKDLRITMTREEAVEALLSQDIKQYMKESVASKKTNIEMISGKTELFSKGYLNMYNKLK